MGLDATLCDTQHKEVVCLHSIIEYGIIGLLVILFVALKGAKL